MTTKLQKVCAFFIGRGIESVIYCHFSALHPFSSPLLEESFPLEIDRNRIGSWPHIAKNYQVVWNLAVSKLCEAANFLLIWGFSAYLFHCTVPWGVSTTDMRTFDVRKSAFFSCKYEWYTWFIESLFLEYFTQLTNSHLNEEKIWRNSDWILSLFLM